MFDSRLHIPITLCLGRESDVLLTACFWQATEAELTVTSFI